MPARVHCACACGCDIRGEGEGVLEHMIMSAWQVGYLAFREREVGKATCRKAKR